MSEQSLCRLEAQRLTFTDSADPASSCRLEGQRLCRQVTAYARHFLGPISKARSEYVCEVLGTTDGFSTDHRYLVEAIANPLLLALSGENARHIHFCYELVQRCRVAMPRDLDWSKDMSRALAWSRGGGGPRQRAGSAFDWMVIDYVCLNLQRSDLPLDEARYGYLAGRLKDMIHVLLAAQN